MGLFNKLFKPSRDNKTSNKPLNLLVGDIILLWCFQNTRNINDTYPSYFEYKYGINANLHAKLLLKNNFIVEANKYAILNYLKVSELKEICSKNNLKLTGKKEQLIERLLDIDNINVDNFANLYMLSPEGIKVLQENYDYIKYHKDSFDLTVSEFTSNLQKYGSYEQVFINTFSINEISLANKNNWGLYRCNKLHLAYFWQLQNDYEKMMLYYIETFYCDMSGYNNGYRDSFKDLMLAPGIVVNFKKYNAYFRDNMVDIAIQECKVPNHFFSPSGFKKMILYLLENDNLDHEKLSNFR